MFRRTEKSGFVVLMLFVFMIAMVSGCDPDETVPEPTPFSLPIPKYFPTKLNIPPDNPLTVEGI